MKRKSVPEESRFCPLPEIYTKDEKLHARILARKFEALDYVIAVLNPESKVSPHVYRHAGKIDWTSLQDQPWTEDQVLAIQWMKSIWTEEIHLEPLQLTGLWPLDHGLRGAIITALAVDSHTAYLIEGYRKSKNNAGLIALLTGRGAA